ncbi:hypothetical protein H4582DRAFT_1474939 [Lactarius indigo]|nr:hypothetical protein H4582DRAFT_1474939 [Lactarius indigo]
MTAKSDMENFLRACRERPLGSRRSARGTDWAHVKTHRLHRKMAMSVPVFEITLPPMTGLGQAQLNMSHKKSHHNDRFTGIQPRCTYLGTHVKVTVMRTRMAETSCLPRACSAETDLIYQHSTALVLCSFLKHRPSATAPKASLCHGATGLRVHTSNSRNTYGPLCWSMVHKALEQALEAYILGAPNRSRMVCERSSVDAGDQSSPLPDHTPKHFLEAIKCLSETYNKRT